MGSPLPARAKPPLPPGAERRRHERFELLAQVELRRNAEVSVLPVANISAGGMLVKLEGSELSDIAVGEDVSVFLDITDLREPITLTIDATVVRLHGVASVALRWKSPNAATLAPLSRLLEYLQSR